MNSNTKNLIKDPPAEKSISAKIDKMRDFIKRSAIGDDPVAILDQAQQELDNTNSNQKITKESSLFKAFTIFEFDKGILMSSAIPEKYRAFCINLSRGLQEEYQCKTPSEQATAELVALNFTRTLAIQTKINNYLALESITDMGVKYLAILSKELDKANRHYLNALQTLKMIKQPAFEVNIKTQTAVVGQNQMIQSNNK